MNLELKLHELQIRCPHFLFQTQLLNYTSAERGSLRKEGGIVASRMKTLTVNIDVHTTYVWEHACLNIYNRYMESLTLISCKLLWKPMEETQIKHTKNFSLR